MKRVFCAVLSILIVLALSVTAFAAKGAVADQAELLSPVELSQLEERLSQVSQKHGIDIVVLTVDSLDGRSAMDYADDYYDYSGYGDDGVLLLVSMNDGQWWISTAGKCINGLNIPGFEEDLVEDLGWDRYYDAFMGFADKVDRQMSVSPVAVVICILLGAAAGLVVMLVIKGKMKTVRRQSAADSYVTGAHLNLTNQADIFLYQTVSRRAKPQSSSGGTHVGSSGRTHGGGGGTF